MTIQKCLFIMYGWMKTGGTSSSRPAGSSKDANESEGDFEVGFVADEDPHYLMSEGFRDRWLDWLSGSVRSIYYEGSGETRKRRLGIEARRLNFRLKNLRDIHYGIMDVAPASKRDLTATVTWNLFRVRKDVGEGNVWQPVDAVLLRTQTIAQRFALRGSVRYRPGAASKGGTKPSPRRLHTFRGWTDPVVGASVDWDHGAPEDAMRPAPGDYVTERAEGKVHVFFPDVAPGGPRFALRRAAKDDVRRLVMDHTRHGQSLGPWNRHDEGILFRWKRRKEETEWTEYPLWRRA